MAAPALKKKILVVDDEATVLKSIKITIEHHLPDYIVDVARNGFDAIEIFSQKRHNLVIMDISMPVLDGIKSQYEIQTMCENRDWPIPDFIFCTGYLPSEEVHRLLRENPSCSLIMKPVLPQMLIAQIKQRLSPEKREAQARALADL
ncbi:MAG: response regulator [Magnetococcus sp. WYHC-3]